MRNVNRTVGTLLGSRGHPPLRRAGPARRHHPRHAHRLGGPVDRRVPAARHHPRARSVTPTTMSARGFRAAASSSDRPTTCCSCPRTTSSPATPCSTAPPSGEVYLRGRVGERFCRPQLRRAGRRRGRRRPRLRVHDRRPGRGARQDRPQHGGGHVGRHRLRARPRPRRRSTPRWSSCSASNPRTWPGCATSSRSTPHYTGSTVADLGAVRLAKAQRAIHQDHADATTSACWRPPGWPRRRAATSTPRSWRRAVADPTRISRGAQGRGGQATRRRAGRRLARGLRAPGSARSGPARCPSRPVAAWTAESRSATPELRAARWAI